jgi:hypothetical protein
VRLQLQLQQRLISSAKRSGGFKSNPIKPANAKQHMGETNNNKESGMY